MQGTEVDYIPYNVQGTMTVPKYKIFLRFVPEFPQNLCIQIASLQACVVGMYFAFVLDNATTTCNFKT